MLEENHFQIHCEHTVMKKVLFAIIGVFYCVHLNWANEEEVSIIKDDISIYNPEAILESHAGQKMITAIYRRAMVQALQSKVMELQTKMVNGENGVPSAIEILKVVLLSDPNQMQ